MFREGECISLATYEPHVPMTSRDGRFQNPWSSRRYQYASREKKYKCQMIGLLMDKESGESPLLEATKVTLGHSEVNTLARAAYHTPSRLYSTIRTNPILRDSLRTSTRYPVPTAPSRMQTGEKEKLS